MEKKTFFFFLILNPFWRSWNETHFPFLFLFYWTRFLHPSRFFFCTRETISSVTPLHWVHFIALSKQNPIIKKKKKKKKKGRGPGCKKTANLIRGPHSKIVYSQDFVTRALLINSKYHIIIKDSTNFFSHFFVFSFILYFLFPCLFHIFFSPLFFFLLFHKLRSSLFLPWIGIFCVQ